MDQKPTYEELQQRVEQLEKKLWGASEREVKSEKNKGVGKSLMEIIGAASEIIEMDEFRRLPHLYAGLPDELS